MHAEKNPTSSQPVSKNAPFELNIIENSNLDDVTTGWFPLDNCALSVETGGPHVFPPMASDSLGPCVDLMVAGLHIYPVDRKARFKYLRKKTDKAVFENKMKWSWTEPQEGKFNYKEDDELEDWCKSHNVEIRELDVSSANEYIRAYDLEVMLREAFAHPAVDGMNLWGFGSYTCPENMLI
ncbi:hypothetical protein GH714_010265 [Hevea brasiliensis]|uniref:GH10 domain-containing protein n=1 Tax=Hevea brasiliensis TaxID=3981 RepID=A0A6A6NGC9_HEVBR|nr:hypothetical protein GH714_010265 [Hevea brasiliensis]